MKIVFIGAGNVATHLASELYKKGYRIAQVFSRTEKSAKVLADKVQASFTTFPQEIVPDADLYFYAVKDDALLPMIELTDIREGIHLHTAGTVPLSIFESKRKNYGVFYPLQTFSKKKPVNFKQLPICIEANNSETLKKVTEIARSLSEKIVEADSEKRAKIHLAAVFACNFTNHLFAIANELLEETSFEILLPLIGETVEKVKKIAPKDAQTGPAQRGDKKIIKKHLEALKKQPEWKEIYRILSEDIEQFS